MAKETDIEAFENAQVNLPAFSLTQWSRFMGMKVARTAGRKRAVKRNWNCVVSTHFLPQKYTPLSTSISTLHSKFPMSLHCRGHWRKELTLRHEKIHRPQVNLLAFFLCVNVNGLPKFNLNQFYIFGGHHCHSTNLASSHFQTPPGYEEDGLM